MPFIDYEGAKVHYEIEGDGQNITLLHGIASSLKYWCIQTKVLSKMFRVIPMDHRGHGLSDGMIAKKSFTVPELALNVEAVLRALDVEQTLMMGHSLGGITALDYTLENPSKVKALILVDTAAGGQGIARRLAAAMLVASYPSRTVRRSLLKKFPLGSQASEEIINWFLDQSDSVNWSATAKIARGLRNFDLSSRLAEIRCPTLIVCGEHDNLTPIRMSQFMQQRIKGSELRIIEAAAHCSSAEQPDEFNRIIVQFLETTEKAGL